MYVCSSFSRCSKTIRPILTKMTEIILRNISKMYRVVLTPFENIPNSISNQKQLVGFPISVE